MATWYSRVLANTTSSISSLQSRLLQSENDGDTEDDTHVCRVLREYYTEKGRPFPGWLPPDPKAPPPAAPVYVQPQVGSRYGVPQQQTSSGSFSSLWDSNPGQQRQDTPQSLRQGRGGVGTSASPFQQVPVQQPQQQPSGSRLSPFQRGGGGGSMSGSTPPMSSAGGGGSIGGGSGGGSAQDRLRQRLYGGGARTTSPASSGQGPFQPPHTGGGGNSYEDRFAPGGTYDSSRGGGGGSDKPFLGANAPWANHEPDFLGGGGLGGDGGGGGGGSGRSGYSGLPAGPRRGGLPSGPRMR